MSDLASRMMESGVLRPGDRQIRRGSSGVPLHAPRQVSDFLNHSVEVLFGPALKPDQQKMTKVLSQPQPNKSTPFRPAPSRFSPKGILVRLGLLDQTKGSCPDLPPPQLPVIRLEAQMHDLELRLKTEQALCRTQREELINLRAQANRIPVLEADLIVEREASSRLVHWLREAEHELASLRRQKSSEDTNPGCGAI